MKLATTQGSLKTVIRTP